MPGSSGIVEHEWPGTEEAFGGFEPEVVAGLDDQDIDTLAVDPRVVRNRSKIASIRDNARWIVRVAAAEGSFGKFLADWPEDDVVGLWAEMRKQGARLGGMTGPFILRLVGWLRDRVHRGWPSPFGISSTWG